MIAVCGRNVDVYKRQDDISIGNVLRQSLQLIAQFPLLAVYGYQAYRHYHLGDSLVIHPPEPTLSTAENILLTVSYTHLYIDGEKVELEKPVPRGSGPVTQIISGLYRKVSSCFYVDNIRQMCIRDRG